MHATLLKVKKIFSHVSQIILIRPVKNLVLLFIIITIVRINNYGKFTLSCGVK